MSDRQIREVWASNLEEEFLCISRLAEDYSYVGMDTEFPGLVAKTAHSFGNAEERAYHQHSLNANLLRIIQIGITLGDRSGGICSPVCTWQFNFKFNLAEDLYAPESMNMLKQARIDFPRLEQEGIDVHDFAHMLLSSGLVMNEEIIWVSFHGGYDFAYLVKMLTGLPLPPTEDEFRKRLMVYFPRFYDLKYLMSMKGQSAGGLQDIANDLDVKRLGIQHQAGSDSYVTLVCFYEFMKENFYGGFECERFESTLFGLSGVL
jgi:CCR4-NOT transcription complex subunit 7/8